LPNHIKHSSSLESDKKLRSANEGEKRDIKQRLRIMLKKRYIDFQKKDPLKKVHFSRNHRELYVVLGMVRAN